MLNLSVNQNGFQSMLSPEKPYKYPIYNTPIATDKRKDEMVNTKSCVFLCEKLFTRLYLQTTSSL